MRSARRSSTRSASCRGTASRARRPGCSHVIARRSSRILRGLTRLVELGPGDGRKLQTLVAGTSEPLTAHLVDVSAGALARAAHTLSDAPNVTRRHAPGVVRGRARRDHARRPPAIAPHAGAVPRLEHRQLRPARVRSAARAAFAPRSRPGDALLIGADLVKPERDLLLAYDDPLGVSAAFNLNVLLRINRELGGNVRPARASAIAPSGMRRARAWRCSSSPTRRSACASTAIDLEIDLRDGEAIWTESSYKYTPEGIDRRSSRQPDSRRWRSGSTRDAGFALTLARTA